MSGKERLITLWKLCVSFAKRDWKLQDYPIVIRNQKASDSGPSARERTPPPYAALIVNWWVMTGVGNTPAEAMENLRNHFEQTKESRIQGGKRMPRPGRRVPVEFAPSDRVCAHAELKEDFIRRVLGLDWAFVSDESSLSDFHTDETNEVFSLRSGISMGSMYRISSPEISQRFLIGSPRASIAKSPQRTTCKAPLHITEHA
jgi:hypothetical protein